MKYRALKTAVAAGFIMTILISAPVVILANVVKQKATSTHDDGRLSVNATMVLAEIDVD